MDRMPRKASCSSSKLIATSSPQLDSDISASRNAKCASENEMGRQKVLGEQPVGSGARCPPVHELEAPASIVKSAKRIELDNMRASPSSSYIEVPSDVEVSPVERQERPTGLYRNLTASWSASNLLSNHLRPTALKDDSLRPVKPTLSSVTHNVLRKSSMGNPPSTRPSTTHPTYDKRKLASSRSMALLRRQWSSRAHVSIGSKSSPRKSPLRSPASAPANSKLGSPPDGKLDHRRPHAVYTLPLPSPTRNRPLPPVPRELAGISIPMNVVKRKPVPLEVFSTSPRATSPIPVPSIQEKQAVEAIPSSGESASTKSDDSHRNATTLTTSADGDDTVYARFADLDIAEQFDMLFNDLSLRQDDEVVHTRPKPSMMAPSHVGEAKLRSSRAQFPEVSSLLTRHDSLQAHPHDTLPSKGHAFPDDSVWRSTGYTPGPFGSLPGTTRIQRSASTSVTPLSTAPLALKPHHIGNRPMGTRVRAAVAQFEKIEIENRDPALSTPIKKLGSILRQQTQVSSSDLTRESKRLMENARKRKLQK